MTAAAAKPLVVISSRTGNTMILGHAICDAMPGAVLVKPEALPEDLSGFNPILLGFWCDRGMAPEDIQAAAKKLEGKTIGCSPRASARKLQTRLEAWQPRSSFVKTAQIFSPLRISKVSALQPEYPTQWTGGLPHLARFRPEDTTRSISSARRSFFSFLFLTSSAVS